MQRSMSIRSFISAIERLPSVKPNVTSESWYQTEKERWLGWLREYHGPGAYGRKSTIRRDARFAYNHIVQVNMLQWLANTTGVKRSAIKEANAAVSRVVSLASKAGAFRKYVPWNLIDTALRAPFDHHQRQLKIEVQLSDVCVYTIATPERLLEASKLQMPLFESKRWVRASDYLKHAHYAGQELPVVFADSRDCSKLIAWSVLRTVTVATNETRYTIGELWALPQSRPQDLQLLNSKKYIATGFIRPYALCQTPDFLRVEVRKPKKWLQPEATIRKVREGKRRLTSHMRLERNSGIVNKLKKKIMEDGNGRLPCEICGFDFLETYGPIGAGFAEAHHMKSLASSPKGGRITSLDDLVVVCANCHRMLHRTPELPSVEVLRKQMRNASKKVKH